MPNVVQENVIRLGTQIDNQGVEQILKLLDLNKLKALGMAAAFSGLATAVYKFVESAAKEELELEQLAKKKNKDIETTRAQEAALKAMGKTMEDIKKDKALKSVYEDIVKLNKSLEMPNAKEAMAKVTELRNSFWALRSMVNYATTAIGHQVLINLERPIQRINEALKNGQEWIRDNWSGIVSNISLGLTDFAKGFLGIGEAVGAVVSFIDELPDGVKQAGLALAEVMLFFTGGPIAQALMLIPTIGDIIHDWDNYNSNKAAGLNPGDPGYTDVAFTGIWETLEDNALTNPEKFERIASMLLTGFADAFNNALQMPDGKSSITKMLFGEEGTGEAGGGILGSIASWLENNSDQLESFGSAFIGWAARAIQTYVGAGGNIVARIFDQVFGEGTTAASVKENAAEGTAFAGAIGGFVASVLEGISGANGNLAEAFKKGLVFDSIQGGVLGALLGAIVGNIKIEEGKVEIPWEKVQGDLGEVGRSFLGIFDRIFDGTTDIAGVVFTKLGEMIGNINIDTGDGKSAFADFTEKLGAAVEGWGQDETITDAIVSGIGGWVLSGGNIAATLFSTIVGAFHGSKGEVIAGLREQYGKEVADLTDDEIWAQFGSTSLVTAEMSESAAKMISNIWDVICSAASGASDIGGQLLSTLLTSIVGAMSSNGVTGNVQSAIEGLADNSIFEGIGVTLGTTIATGGNFFAGLATGLFTTFTDLQGQVDSGEYSNLWEALKGSASVFWEKIQDVWLGPIIDEAGTRNEALGLKSIFDPMFQEIQAALSAAWEGTEDGGGIKKLFDDIAAELPGWLEPVKQAISLFFKGVWADVFNSAPEWMKKVFIELGGKDPNFTTYSTDKETGKTTLTRSDNQKMVVDSEIGALLEAYGAELDAEGKLVIPNMQSGFYQGVGPGLEGSPQDYLNWALSDEFSPLIPGQTPVQTVRSILKQYGLTEPGGGSSGGVVPDYVPQDDQDRLGKGTKDVTKNLTEVSASASAAADSESDLANNASSAGSKVSTFGENAKTAGENATTAATKLTTLGSSADTLSNKFANFKLPSVAAARGGRFGHQVDNLTVGEDGPEYIIPITKPERAFSLISQMLAEMGNSAITRVISDFSLGRAGTVGGMDGLDIMRSVATNNVNANVYINVNAAGSDPVSVGRSAYDAAERHLMKTLRGAYA